MRDRASLTAAWVAACRTLGRVLPEEARLAEDPYGAAFAGEGVAFLARHVPGVLALPLWPFVIYMQVRTRVIDDVVRGFVEGGGRQILILGAGYDCRAVRLGAELRGARVFEVDHPATQARKRDVLDRAGAQQAAVRYVAWDFEARPVEELPRALGDVGHEAGQGTLTIWEGVTMYLTEAAIEGTVAAVRALSAAGSSLVMTYFDRGRVERPTAMRAIISKVVAAGGEPFRFGWDPAALPGWVGARGFERIWDRDMADLARDLLPERYARVVRERASRIALLRVK